MHLVGLSGIPQSGKDTVAAVLVERDGWYRLSVGDLIRREAAKRYGLPVEFFERRETKELPADELGGKSPRQVLIDIGVEEKERHGPDYWATLLLAPLYELEDRGVPGVVISDIGNQAEADFVRDELGMIVRLERPGIEPIADGRVLVWPDALVANDGTPELAADRVLELVRARCRAGAWCRDELPGDAD